MTDQTPAPHSDPYLQYQPHFARSLPVQLLLTGVVLTLTTTLLVQLFFTWQYHWPLARINWMLQFTGVCTLLLNITSILYVVLAALAEKSKQWPYMFEYVAIDVPRVGSWTTPEIAAWYVMEAATSALASVSSILYVPQVFASPTSQITHIQFLTFLYPSRLEARLVFFLLGSLSIVASIMTLLPISTYYVSTASNSSSSFNLTAYNDTLPQLNASVVLAMNRPTTNVSSKQQQLLDIFESARNICNLTLSLLFTLSLLIWGFLINRHSAWRTDGGTAAFGAGAIFLALVSTGLNFLNVLSNRHFEWLSSLLWSVVLWQSFLGWWWWVGSASGIAAREFDSEKRGRKAQKRAKRKRCKVAENEDEASVAPTGGTTGRLERWRSSVGETLSRRRPPANDAIPSSQTSTIQGETIELTTIGSVPSPPEDHTAHANTRSTSSIATSGASWSSTHFFSAAWRTLRQAHVRAARVQAIEQRQIQIQMELENGRGLGRFPGGTGGERERTIARSDEDPGTSDQEGPGRNSEVARRGGQKKGNDASSGGMWWWGPLRRWRFRDSTIY